MKLVLSFPLAWRCAPLARLHAPLLWLALMLLPAPWVFAADSQGQIQQLEQRIGQLTADIKTAMQEKDGDKAKHLRAQRSEL